MKFIKPEIRVISFDSVDPIKSTCGDNCSDCFGPIINAGDPTIYYHHSSNCSIPNEIRGVWSLTPCECITGKISS